MPLTLAVPMEQPVGVGDADADTRFAAAVAAFGMLLRESEHAGIATLGMVLELAGPSAGRDEHRARREGHL